MNRLNPNAIAMWGFMAGIGYLIGGSHGAVVGLVVGLGISLLVA